MCVCVFLPPSLPESFSHPRPPPSIPRSLTSFHRPCPSPATPFQAEYAGCGRGGEELSSLWVQEDSGDDNEGSVLFLHARRAHTRASMQHGRPRALAHAQARSSTLVNRHCFPLSLSSSLPLPLLSLAFSISLSPLPSCLFLVARSACSTPGSSTPACRRTAPSAGPSPGALSASPVTWPVHVPLSHIGPPYRSPYLR